MYSGFLTGSDRKQDSQLARAGFAAVAVVAVVIVLTAVLRPVLQRPGSDRLVFSVDTPTLGVGVESQTPVILRGIQVGVVKDVSISGGGMPRIELDLDRGSVGALHQNFAFDFRPQNYFGVTAVNIINAGTPASPELSTGAAIRRGSARDYTMGTMIDRGSEMVDGTLRQPMTDAIRRSLAYSSALEPLMHTGVILAAAIEKTQRQLPSELISQYNDIARALPPFTLGVVDAGFATYSSDMRLAGDDVMARYATALQAIAESFFSMVGELLGGKQTELTPLVKMLEEAASVLPATSSGLLTPMTLRELITRLNGAFVPGHDGGRALKIKIDFDVLPVVQTAAVSASTRGLRAARDESGGER